MIAAPKTLLRIGSACILPWSSHFHGKHNIKSPKSGTEIMPVPAYFSSTSGWAFLCLEKLLASGHQLFSQTESFAVKGMTVDECCIKEEINASCLHTSDIPPFLCILIFVFTFNRGMSDALICVHLMTTMHTSNLCLFCPSIWLLAKCTSQFAPNTKFHLARLKPNLASRKISPHFPSPFFSPPDTQLAG